MRRHRADDGRRVLRAAWISVVEMVVIFGGIAAAIYPSRPDGFTAGLPIVGVLAVAVIGLRVLDVPRRTPDCRSDAALAEWFRRRFFFRVASAMTVMLFGFVFTTMGTGPECVVVAAVVTLGLLVVDVPSRANLEREEAALGRSGCDRSLLGALAAGLGPGRRG